MVLKLDWYLKFHYSSFESSVNSDGTQTKQIKEECPDWFESSVNSDGTQTIMLNSVVM